MDSTTLVALALLGAALAVAIGQHRVRRRSGRHRPGRNPPVAFTLHHDLARARRAGIRRRTMRTRTAPRHRPAQAPRTVRSTLHRTGIARLLQPNGARA